ncbi:MAG: hypothetical protein IKE55_04825 [Kiritimatiellae bacterium]|nr:hypothetical protein [Kiritimatiellia bacterium]
MKDACWYLRTQDETFGPATEAQLVEWAKLGRVQPGQEVSDDNIEWRRVEDVPFLDMRFSIDIGDGNPRGPFNRVAAESLLASGRLPPTATMLETRPPFESDEPAKAAAETARPADPPASAKAEGKPKPEVRVVEKVVEVPVEKIVEKEVRVEVPVEKIVEKEVPVERIVEKVVEVPVEKIVEKEVRVEVPVEKIVEKVVVDETRVKELEELLAEERRHTSKLQTRLDAAAANASEAAKAATAREAALEAKLREVTEHDGKMVEALRDATDREAKYSEQVAHLEDELRRLPQAASEVADIQAAVYSIMKTEAEEIDRLIDAEKREFEEFRQRHAARGDRLLERRRELLKRTGVNIEDMTRRALLERPEDPRTVQLRKELEEQRREHERQMFDAQSQLKELSDKLRRREADDARAAEGLKDVTQLRQEVQSLRERLQVREQELLTERQRGEELRQQQATRQQMLMARLATLESPSIGTSQTLSTNLSRETRQVKLPSWMRLKR